MAPLEKKHFDVTAGKPSPLEKKHSNVPAGESPVPQVAAQDTTKTSVSIGGSGNQNYAGPNTNNGQNAGNGNTYHMSQSKAPAAEPPPVREEDDEEAKYPVRIGGYRNQNYAKTNTNSGQNSGNGNSYRF